LSGEGNSLQLFDAVADGGVEAGALVCEVFVEGGAGDARAGDDVSDRRRREGLLGTALDHRVEDALTLCLLADVKRSSRPQDTGRSFRTPMFLHRLRFSHPARRLNSRLSRVVIPRTKIRQFLFVC
jgi:hypothetical protein